MSVPSIQSIARSVAKAGSCLLAAYCTVQGRQMKGNSNCHFTDGEVRHRQLVTCHLPGHKNKNSFIALCSVLCPERASPSLLLGSSAALLQPAFIRVEMAQQHHWSPALWDLSRPADYMRTNRPPLLK